MLKIKTIGKDAKDDFDKEVNDFLAAQKAVVNVEFAIGNVSSSYNYIAFILYSDEE